MKNTLIELAERNQDGVEVRLLWHRDGGEVVLQVEDDRSGESYELQIAPDRAMDAFQHPFVYVSSSSSDVACGVD